MRTSVNFRTPPINVLFICSCDNVDHKQEACFLLTRTFFIRNVQSILNITIKSGYTYNLHLFVQGGIIN